LNIIKYVWAQIGLALVVGVGLIYFVPKSSSVYIVAEHLGLGLIVAAIVTAFWQLRELTEFFQSLARSTLIEDGYLNRLRIGSLRTLRSRAASAIVSRIVDNPRYKWQQLEQWVDTELFEKCLPGDVPLSGVYREDLRDEITLEFISLRDALRETKIKSDGFPPEALNQDILKQTIKTTYTVIAPKKDSDLYRHYKVTISERVADVPYLRSELLFQFFVGHGESDAVKVDCKPTPRKAGGVEFNGEHSIPIVNGEAKVYTSRVIFSLPHREPFALQTMAVLTHDLQAHLTVDRKNFVLDGDVIGLGGKATKRGDKNWIALEYKGWLFENHGYIISWWETEAASPDVQTG